MDFYWKRLLQLKLREANANAFQEFFSEVMQQKYGEDFLKIRPHGSFGDAGCDGYLTSEKCVFQCYGATNGSAGNVAQLKRKIEEDFDKAINNANLEMRKWIFVHNLIDGLPEAIVQKIEQLKNDNKTIEISTMGSHKFETIFSDFKSDQLEGFFGAIATSQDYMNAQPELIRDIINTLMESEDTSTIDKQPLEPVPIGKLDENGLSQPWKDAIANARKYTPKVARYLANHHDNLRADKLASHFKNKYADLKNQNLDPDVIMDNLLMFTIGDVVHKKSKTVAADILLAYLFDLCEIFESSGLEVTK
ncbi:ABC-three component system protein [uncultured Candidatus Puniceispirillum sp.]|jgi:hypothetical protein|uniref:ABC-three component system protein n=1 Tax=uncultured Candidatus Puniceispirillum sp. TaxID=1985115 RepID=UPI0032B1E916